ncbi:MAG: ABC transporter permease, partial [Pseudomonadota bacterium]|nr:ABC transporter permease [Pseudomonadota bacterium]
MPENQRSNSSIALRRVTGDQGAPRLMLTGNCTVAALGQRLHALSAELAASATDPDLQWDLTGVEQMDDAGAVLLWRAWGSRRPQHLLLRPEQERLFNRMKEAPVPPAPIARDLLWPVTVLGKAFFLLCEHLIGLVIL